MRVKTADGEQSIFVGGGALEVQPNKVTILRTPPCARPTSTRLQPSLPSSVPKKALADKTDKIDQAQALAELAQAAAQLKLLEKIRKTRG